MEDERWTRVPAHGNIPSHLVYSKEIEKPDSDDRSYRLIKLENGLEALLIHDSTTDKAAAAMNVGVGSLSDPVGLTERL
jgi:insulysin